MERRFGTGLALARHTMLRFSPPLYSGLFVACFMGPVGCTTQVGGTEPGPAPERKADASERVDTPDARPPPPDAEAVFMGPCVEGDARTETPDGVCFMYFNPKLSWSDARTACKALSGDLAHVIDANANTDVRRLVPFGAAWILGTDEQAEGSWSWAGAPIAELRWGAGQPDGGAGENCMTIDKGGAWADLGCVVTASYVCERQSVSD